MRDKHHVARQVTHPAHDGIHTRGRDVGVRAQHIAQTVAKVRQCPLAHPAQVAFEKAQPIVGPHAVVLEGLCRVPKVYGQLQLRSVRPEARARVEYGGKPRSAKGLHIAHDAEVAPVRSRFAST